MIDNDEVLESMEADILGILQYTPSLKGHVFKDTEGDFNSRLEKSLGTKTAGSTGKRGLAIIVLQIDVTEAEKNLPGPPLNLRVRVLIIENIVINRSTTRGTLQRSSQAALHILNTLQLSQLGNYALYADKAPLAPQTVPEGLSSHMVTLYVRSGMNPVSKPLAVQAAMAQTLTVTGSLTPNATGTFLPAGKTGPDDCWSSTGSQTESSYPYRFLSYDPDENVFVLSRSSSFGVAVQWSGAALLGPYTRIREAAAAVRLR